MKKNIFFHIGLWKTGTTSIQNALKICKDSGKLENLGVDLHCAGVDSIWMNNILYPDNHEYARKWFSDKIELSFKKDNINTLIFSSEIFCTNIVNNEFMLSSFMAPILKEAFKKNNTYIIIYLRRQDLLLESTLPQLISSGFYRESFNTYFENVKESFSFKHFINGYANYFGKDNIILRIYESDFLVNNNSVDDFFHLVGLESLLPISLKDVNTNSSLTPHSTRVLNVLNSTLTLNEKERKKRISLLDENVLDKYDPTYAHNKIWLQLGLDKQHLEKCGYYKFVHMLKNLKHKSSSKNHFMKPENRREFLAQYEEDNAYIAREYFGREDGKLFNDKFPENIVSLDEPSTSDIVTVFLPIFQHLQERIQQLESNTNSTQLQVLEAQLQQNQVRLKTIERRLGYIKAPWKVFPVIVRRICKKCNLQEKTPALYTFMRAVYRKFSFWK